MFVSLRRRFIVFVVAMFRVSLVSIFDMKFQSKKSATHMKLEDCAEVNAKEPNMEGAIQCLTVNTVFTVRHVKWKFALREDASSADSVQDLMRSIPSLCVKYFSTSIYRILYSDGPLLEASEVLEYKPKRIACMRGIARR